MNPYVQYMYSYPHKTAYRPLKGFSLASYVHLLKGGGHGLYVHLPFCQTKCGYCNLFSVTGQGPEQTDQYLDALGRQCIQYRGLLHPVQARFDELVIGGGTPLYLSQNQLERLFGMLAGWFSFCEKPDIVIETAPNQTDAQKLKLLKQAGVTRVSMGIQSFQDIELAALRRAHDAAAAQTALHLVKSAGFSCVNTDFIYGIPGQTTKSLLSSLKKALSFCPDEIFLYPLYVKHGAGLLHDGVVPDAGQAYIQYQHAADFLKSNGWRQDSMRRFVHRKEDTAYDYMREYRDCGSGTSLALGCAGRSYLGRLHFSSPYAVAKTECLKRIAEYNHTEDFTKITHGIVLSEQEQKRRYVIRHLLIMPGISPDRYKAEFQSSLLEDFPVLSKWTDSGYVTSVTRPKVKDSRPEPSSGQNVSEGCETYLALAENVPEGCETYLALTEKGMGLSDYLGPQLISPEIQALMEEWEEVQTFDRLSWKSQKL